MSNSYLNEAFKKLGCLDEETFQANLDGFEELKRFQEIDGSTVTIIDPEASTVDDLKDSYIGKVIIDCNVCHSKIYKDAADIVIDEESDSANVTEQCPFCYSQDGFKIIGQVADYCSNCSSEDDADATLADDIAVEDNAEDGTAEVEEKLTEDVGDDSPSNTYDEVLFCLDQHDYDTDSEETQNYAAAAAEYIDMYRANTEEDYTVDMWYKDTSTNYPEDLADIPKRSSMNESVENVSIETESQTVKVEDGVTTIVDKRAESEVSESTDEDEVIVPVSDETEAAIESNSQGDEEIDFDIDDFDEDDFDSLGEQYLKNAYHNVNGYKTTDISSDGKKLKLEGVITFASGAQKNTTFLFESKDALKKGKVRFIGENCQICRGKKAFTLTGSVDDKKFIAESLNYNYRTKDAEGNSCRLYGTVKTKKN